MTLYTGVRSCVLHITWIYRLFRRNLDKSNNFCYVLNIFFCFIVIIDKLLYLRFFVAYENVNFFQWNESLAPFRCRVVRYIRHRRGNRHYHKLCKIVENQRSNENVQDQIDMYLNRFVSRLLWISQKKKLFLIFSRMKSTANNWNLYTVSRKRVVASVKTWRTCVSTGNRTVRDDGNAAARFGPRRRF